MFFNALRLCVVFLVVLVATTAFTDVPTSMNVQGQLTDANGVPLSDSTLTFIFKIYDAGVGGSEIWPDVLDEELQTLTTNQSGLWNAHIGAVIPLTEVVFADTARWLEITVGGEILSRVKLNTNPFAYRAASSQKADTALVLILGMNGWVDDGTVVRLEIDTDSVGIGTSSPSANLHVEGTLQVTDKGSFGPDNSNPGVNAFVAGSADTAGGNYSTVGGGQMNVAGATLSTIGGGNINRVSNEYGTIGGGSENEVAGFGGTIAGGRGNTASYSYATVGGGYRNYARGSYSVVAGGGGESDTDSNLALGDYSVVSGGQSNVASGNGATISGGYDNVAGPNATVAGGYDNVAEASQSAIGGGRSNSVVKVGVEEGSIIGGGVGNSATGFYNVIAGGYANIVGGNSNAICGGREHVNLAAEMSVIVGGQHDTLTAEAGGSMVFGNWVYLESPRRVAFFQGRQDGYFGVNRDDHDGGINYPIHVGSQTDDGNGAHLTPGGTWTNGSSREFKDSFESLNGETVLEKIARMSIEAWEYKDGDERHIGPVAEDFVGAFDVGTIREDGTRDNEYISHGDVAGVALVAIQELHKKTQKIEKLEAEMAEMRALLEKLLAEQR